MFKSVLILLFLTGFVNSCIPTNQIVIPPSPIVDRTGTHHRTLTRTRDIKKECAVLQMAFKLCPHVSDGFTWTEVWDCKKKFGNLDLSIAMLKKRDFKIMDMNGDGMMTMQ